MGGLSRHDIKSGLFWNAVEMYSTQVVQFVIGIIMARLLMPDDYAIIGMITVFLCVSNVLISSGFPTALIRKKECTDADLSTVFWFNILISALLFGLLWLCAPLVADFYGYPILTPVTRAMGLTFMIGSLTGVSETLLKRDLRFRTIAGITLVCAIVTGGVAIWFAYHGFGVWALVIQAVTLSAIRTAIVGVAARWRPRFVFSKASFRELFGFGSKILGSNMVTQLYQNMYNITIGKFFPAAMLAYYTRADGYSRLIPINISGLLQKALFPMLAKIQDDRDALVAFNRKMTEMTSFLIFPASLIMAGVAYPLISVMITDKWLPTAPILQILCISVLPDHLYYINNDFIMIRGRSDYVMREQVYTKLLSAGLLIATLPLGVMWVAVGRGAGALLTWAFSAWYLKRSLGMGVFATVRGIVPMFLWSVLIGAADAWAFTFLPYTMVSLLAVVLVSGGAYLLVAKIFFPHSLKALINLRK